MTGALRTSASIGGTFSAPEYTGQIRGSGLGVRNFLEGVTVTDGDVAIAQKLHAHKEKLAKGVEEKSKKLKESRS